MVCGWQATDSVLRVSVVSGRGQYPCCLGGGSPLQGSGFDIRPIGPRRNEDWWRKDGKGVISGR